jgi:prevent-host-death family protein
MNLPEKRVNATEIKNRLGDYVGEVMRNQGPILIERHGKPAVVVVSVETWGKMENRESREHPWIEAARRLSDEIQRKHPDMKPFSAVELIRQIREERENDI